MLDQWVTLLHSRNFGLGVDTIVGLGKHAAHKIAGTFGRGADERTLDEAIARLEHPAEDFERHVPRWTEDARRAAVWLRDYQMEHFPATTPESS